MPLETATWITDLVPANPAHTDGLNAGDAHMRLMKAVLQAVFPNLNGAVNATPAELNQLHTGTRTVGHADGTNGAPSIYFDSEAGLGFYRASAGHMSVPTGKRLAGNGTIPVGTIHSYPLDPGTALCARGGTATGTEQFVEPDGSVYNISTFPDLGALYGSTFGGNGTTTFGVPDIKTAGKFLRHRTGAVTVGTAQANQNAAHTHSLSVNGTPSGSVTTTSTDAGHQHGVAFTTSVTTAGSGGAFGYVSNVGSGGNSGQSNTGFASISSTSTFTGNSLNSTGTSGTQGGTEARPEAFVVFFCLKT